MLAALPMAADREALVLGLIPRVHASLIVQPRLHFRRVVGENRKRGHTIVPVVLILVIAPDHAEVRLEFIQFPARSPKSLRSCHCDGRRNVPGLRRFPTAGA